uniref:Uncharacterized protein n=1 Tax=Arundo donax TaxID=35708 RepID=A0A0A9B1D4_ARUDO
MLYGSIMQSMYYTWDPGHFCCSML